MGISNKSILIVFFLALIVRLVNLFLLIPDDFNFRLEDQDIYVNLGLSMLETGEFVYNSDNIYITETARTPLYPVFLSAIWNLVGYNPWAVVFIQSIILALMTFTILNLRIAYYRRYCFEEEQSLETQLRLVLLPLLVLSTLQFIKIIDLIDISNILGG